MLCDDCKNKPATIFFKEVLPGKVIELHLCESCAHKRGLMMDKRLSPIEILQKLLKKRSTKDEQVICPDCYLSLAEFKRLGRFGCSHCIENFRPHIENLIKQLHQSSKHIGRRPKQGVRRSFEVFKLREQLSQALDKEAYEDAAQIRDKLKDFGVEDAG
jgi:protein arginine kinase activator